MNEPETVLRELSDRIVETQSDIRVLNAVKWTDDIRDRFFADKFREQPAIDVDYYQREPLDYDPAQLRARFTEIQADAATRLGSTSVAAELIARSCDGYRAALDLIEARGTPAFGVHSRRLYGTPDEVFHAGGPTVADWAASVSETIETQQEAHAAGPAPSTGDVETPLSAPEAVDELQRLVDGSMGSGAVEVKLSDGIVSDAAAGSDYIKLRSEATFTLRDLATLEAHEAWVHIGTTRNGLAQPQATFLGKAAPPTTVTQEGLATLCEIFALRSHPDRLRRLVRRIEGIALVLDGASFVELFEHVRVEGADEDEAWQLCSRIFRGSTPTGPPFGKDLSYGKGLVLAYSYVRLSLREGRADRIPMLFCGKVDLQDMGLVNALFDEGLVTEPAFVPPPFRDTEALAAQIAFSRFLRSVDFDTMAAGYSRLL